MYFSTRDRFIDLLRSLDGDQALMPVPCSPAWTVTGVASHVGGMTAEIASGRLTGLGTDERTAHQVAARADNTLGEICDEWLGHEAPVRVAIDADPWFGARLAADLIVHLHDVQHALGLPIDGDDEATLRAAETYRTILDQRARDILDLEVAVEFSGDEAAPGADLILRASAYDFLRSITGRRGRAQVEALEWSGDPSQLLDGAWSPYGDLPVAGVEV
ncbi:MAG: hypothetical protein GY929_02975 [Actinomycetia bacterium]|nr:hypothetical protein [Actinomycetes bacterium]